jgi:hypothetical protein
LRGASGTGHRAKLADGDDAERVPILAAPPLSARTAASPASAKPHCAPCAAERSGHRRDVNAAGAPRRDFDQAPIAEALAALIGREQETALFLGISPATVNNHVHTIFDTLDVPRRCRIGARLHRPRLRVRAAADVGIPA